MKKLFTSVLLIAATTAIAAGCGKSAKLLENDEYYVEYGDKYAVRPAEDCDVTITDENGKKVTGVRYGAFSPEVGEYTATYTTKDGKKTQSVKIVCKDTIAPKVTFGVYEADVTAGARASVPEFSVTDNSGVKNQSVKVLKQNGEEQSLENGAWVTDAERYTIRVEAEDNQGNKAVADAYLTARTEWHDENLGENVLYSFDDEMYLNLVYGSSDRESFQPSIVREGYPEIENETAGNGVLKLSTECTYGNVYARFVSFDAFAAKRAKKVRFRIAADRDVDYVKIMTADGTDAARKMLLKKNEWTILELDPIDFGYGSTLTDYFLYSRADEGLNLYVDEVTYEPRWVDTDKAENVIADFNEERYAENIYQCVYSGVVYASGGGSAFSIVRYPHDETKTVLKIETTQTQGGFTYMFDEPIKKSEIESLVISIDCVYSCKNLWIGFMMENYRAAGAQGVQDWYDTKEYPDSVPWNGKFDNLGKVDALADLSVPTEFLPDYVTGVFISVIDGSRTGNVIYIDEIRVVKK